MEWKVISIEERHIITDRAAPTCMLCGLPRVVILHRIIDLALKAKKQHYNIRLNKSFRSDLQWWAQFLRTWNGIGMMVKERATSQRVMLMCDASGSWECGAFTSAGDWFLLQWPESWANVHITVKELLPIVISIATWGKQWAEEMGLCHCDNAAVVNILWLGWCRNDLAMHLLRSLFFVSQSPGCTGCNTHSWETEWSSRCTVT